ncbi:uncharacterized protein LOC142335490 [Convolutriloba macropyga]|uniref:uncharacterized protein LOC142335490 n=1 Tax=Convolutriloba macropyga TaxID=536237 RepID=UPI003F524D0C
MDVNAGEDLEMNEFEKPTSRDEHERPLASRSSSRHQTGPQPSDRDERDEKEHRNDSKKNKQPNAGRNSVMDTRGEKRRQNFHRLSRSGSTMSNTMDILSAQQEVAGQRQLNKEEARRLKQLSLKLEQEKKVINQHRATLEKDKEALQKEKREVGERKRQSQLKESGVEEQRNRNDNERNLLSRWHKDLDTREKVISEKERKLLKQQQEFEEYKKEEMLSVHKQRQADIDAVKEENDKLRTQLLKEIDERRELERSYILRDQEALRQERINHQRKVELTEQSHQAKEASFREWEQTLMHERRQINMDKERVEQIKYNTEVLKNKVNLENKVKEQNAQLATRLLEEKRQNDTSANLRHRDKLKVEISKKQFEVEQRQNKYERHNMNTESEIEQAKRTKEKKLDEKEKIVDLRAEQNARILKAQQKQWENTQFENIKNLTTSIVG